MDKFAVLTWDSFEMTYTNVSRAFDSESSAIECARMLYDDLFYRGAPETDYTDYDVAILDLCGNWVPFAHFEYDPDDTDSIELVYNF